MKKLLLLLVFSSQAFAAAPTCFMPGPWPTENGSCFTKAGFEEWCGEDTFNSIHCDQWMGGIWYPNSANCEGHGEMDPPIQ